MMSACVSVFFCEDILVCLESAGRIVNCLRER